VTLTPQVTDLAGNAIANTVFAFTTSTTPDLAPPTIVASSPPYNAVVGTNARVRLVFSEKISPLAINNSTFHLHSSNGGGPVAATAALSPDGLSATLTPQNPLIPFTQYSWSLDSFSDLSGHDGSGTSAYFYTSGGPDTAAPAVYSVSPLNGMTGVPVNAVVVVTLTEQVDLTSITGNTFRLLQGGAPVPGVTTLSYDQKTLTFSRSTLALAPSTTYTIQLSGYSDNSGNIGAPLSTTFTTSASAALDTTKPTLISISPADGSTGVGLTTPVVVTFDEPVRLDSSNSGLGVSVAGVTLSGAVSMSGNALTFTPDGAYPPNSNIFIFISVADLAGNYSSYSKSFRTVATVDSTAPVVTSVTPTDGSTAQSPSATVVLTFSKPLNPNTINTNTIALLNGSARLNASVSRSADGRTVTISPYSNPGRNHSDSRGDQRCHRSGWKSPG